MSVQGVRMCVSILTSVFMLTNRLSMHLFVLFEFKVAIMTIVLWKFLQH